MALDSRNKRASACWPLLPSRGLLPLPDGTIDQADRQTLVLLYAGILANAPPPPPGPRRLHTRAAFRYERGRGRP